MQNASYRPKVLRILGGALFRWEETLAVAALGVMVASVAWGVFTRYVTAQSATWATELAGLAFTWVVFLGAAGALRRRMHVGIDVLTAALPPRAEKALGSAMDLIVLVFLAYTTYLAGLISVEAISRPSPVLRISFFWIYLAVVLGFGSMLVSHLRQMIGRIRGGTA